MSIVNDYYIKPISYKQAMDIVVNCHYAHRKAPCSKAFGLFNKVSGNIVGVCVFGSPASNKTCESICGPDERLNVYELTRLYVDDGLPKNLESFLIAHSIKQLDKEIIISFADSSYNHIGVVYQATNFYYTGTSNNGKSYYWEEIDENGKRLHNKYIFVKYGGIEGIHKAIENGHNIYKVPRTMKYRYVYFNCNKRRKKELLKKLKLQILPYPKQDIPVPNTSEHNIDYYTTSISKPIQRRLF